MSMNGVEAVKLPQTTDQRELFSYILRTRDSGIKKQLVSLLEPEQQKEFIAFYKEAMAKAQEAQRLRAEIARLQSEKEAVLHQYGSAGAGQLGQVVVDSSRPSSTAVLKRK